MNTEPKKTQHPDLPSWRFKPSNLGCLKDNPGEIEFKPLTLICGPNNTGKTWVMYALYGFLSNPGDFIHPDTGDIFISLFEKGHYKLDIEKWLLTSGKFLVDKINASFSYGLSDLFNVRKKDLQGASFDWILEVDDLKKFLIKKSINWIHVYNWNQSHELIISKESESSQISISVSSKFLVDKDDLPRILSRFFLDFIFNLDVFLIPAERNGLNLFYKELSRRRVSYSHTSRPSKIIGDLTIYSKPIADYIDWLNSIPEIMRVLEEGEFSILAKFLENEVVGGNYEVDEVGHVSLHLHGSVNQSSKIDFHLTSSTVKSLFGLWAYLKYKAKSGDVLMIDEPELNLHPGNQRKLARFLSVLVSHGLHVVVSTHSDYLVREINSLLMLSRPHPERAGLMEQFGYTEDEILQPDQVAAWLFSDGMISPMEIDAVEGINAKTFDDEIHQLNDTSDSIYYTYQNSADTEGDA